MKAKKVNEKLSPNFLWNDIHNKVVQLTDDGLLKTEEELQEFIEGVYNDPHSYLPNIDAEGLTLDDVEDAAWAAWEDAKV